MNKSMKIVSACVVFLVVLAAGGYFVAVPHFEKQQTERIHAFLHNLPGDVRAEDIRVNVLRNTAELTGLSVIMTDPLGRDMNAHIDSVILEGMNPDAGKTAGVTDLLDTLTLTGLAVKGSGRIEIIDQPVDEDFTVKEFVVKKLRGDLMAMVSGFSEGGGINLYSAASTFSAASYVAKEYKYASNSVLGPLTMTVDSLTAKDVSLLTSGKCSFENLRASLSGMELIHMELFEAESMAMPDLYAPLFSEMDSASLESGSFFASTLEKNPLVIKGMKISKMTVRPLTKEPLTMAELNLDLNLTAKEMISKSSVLSLVIPAELYGKLGAEFRAFATAYGKPLEFNTDLDADVAYDAGKGAITVSKGVFVERNLGSIAMRLNLPFESEHAGIEDYVGDGLSFDGRTTVFLRTLDLRVKDSGLVHQLIEGQIQQLKDFGLSDQEFADNAVLRKMTAQILLSQAAEMKGADARLLLSGLAQLLEAPGSLSVTLRPETPVDIIKLKEILFTGQPLRAKVEYVPGSAP